MISKISLRLLEISKLAKDSKKLVDFGCDHGFCILECFKNYNLEKAYAIDNKEKPLDNARKNLKGYNTDYILADSFKNLELDFDTCIISGLGSKTIIDILKTAPREKVYILSSNLKSNLLRYYLSSNNFKIIDEKLVFENNKYYEIIKCSDGKMKLSEDELYTGIYLKDDPLYPKYKKYIIERLEKIIKKSPENVKKDLLKIRDYYMSW